MIKNCDRFLSYKETETWGLYPSLDEKFELKSRKDFVDDEDGTKEMVKNFQVMKFEGTPYIRKILSDLPSELNDFDSLHLYLIKVFEENELPVLMYSKDLLFFEKMNLLMANLSLKVK